MDMVPPPLLRNRLLRPLLAAMRGELLLLAAFSLAINLLMLVPTVYLLQLFDRVLASRSELTLLVLSLMALFLFGVLAACEWARSRVLAHVAQRLERQLGERVFSASFEAYLDGSGADAARASADLQQVRQLLQGQLLFALLDLPWTPIYLVAAFLLHPVLGFVGLAFLLIQAGVAWLSHHQALAGSEAASRARTEVHALLQSRLRHAETVEAMGMLANLRRAWRGEHAAALELGSRAHGAAHRGIAWSKFVRHMHQSLALAAGAVLVIHGEISAASMIAANLWINRALVPTDQLASLWRPMLSAWAALARLHLWLEERAPRVRGTVGVAPVGVVELRGVTACARGREAPVLRDLSFWAPAGTLVAITGPSGAGKSTLARVLAGAWPDVRGEVTLDGHPMATLDRAVLGPRIGYLPQDVELFEGSIADNIARLGQVDPAAVIAAARATGLHESILQFPKGYDTPVGEAGGLLSGGQRQRIGLARALYGRPALLVLDEPGANLDQAGEAALRRVLVQLKEEGATVFVVTQLRGGLLPLADEIVVLEDGRIRLQGPPSAVLPALRPPPSGPQSPILTLRPA
jgi:ATP-binding cassette, subfamily C, bacterial exporter for protease/lipase